MSLDFSMNETVSSGSLMFKDPLKLEIGNSDLGFGADDGFEFFADLSSGTFFFFEKYEKIDT